MVEAFANQFLKSNRENLLIEQLPKFPTQACFWTHKFLGPWYEKKGEFGQIVTIFTRENTFSRLRNQSLNVGPILGPKRKVFKGPSLITYVFGWVPPLSRLLQCLVYLSAPAWEVFLVGN